MIPFPFQEKRKFQDNIINDVYSALAKKKNLLISAPTGIGKTISVIYPALLYAYQNSKKILFVTPKTTQQKIVIETLKLLQLENIGFKALIIRAKEKICANHTFLCHPDVCQYIRDYYSKIERSKIAEKLSSYTILEPDTIYTASFKEKICPFEVSLKMIESANIVVCDYNYVFDPVIQKNILGEVKLNEFILIIDEAHNLYQRGREYYSPRIDKNKIVELLDYINRGAETESSKKILAGLTKLEEVLSGLNIEGKIKYKTDIDKDFFIKTGLDMEEPLLEYIKEKKGDNILATDDPVYLFIKDYTKFKDVLKIEGEEFFYIYDNSEGKGSLKILCADPSNMLKTYIYAFYRAIAMSATLYPMAFYMDVLGFDKADTEFVSYPSPFPHENRKIVVIPEISTKYSERRDNYQKIADTISDIVSLKNGHYFAFFPSFEFLREVEGLLDISSFEILSQREGMGEARREIFLNKLRDDSKNILVLAVQGGIFAEGVDYPGDMLIGCMVISPGLPAFSFEQELIKGYYKKRYGKGFEYTYLYPGLNRVIQSVGRVIRTEKDVGIIALIDKRFKTSYYNSLFPSYWYKKSPEELISTDYKKEITEFWERHKI